MYNINSILLVLPLMVAATAFPFNPHGCGLGPGIDVCHEGKGHHCAPLVVRPVELPKPATPTATVVCTSVGGAPPLVPLPGPCHCHTPVVKPATVPKPLCLSCKRTCGCGCVTNNHHLTLSQQQKVLFGGACAEKLLLAGTRPVIVDDSVDSPVNPANYVPADPVSLSVAYKRAQEDCYRNEDKLSFGFRSIPKDIPLYVKKSCHNIPEENLFHLNGQIVELKKIHCQLKKSLDEEAADQLTELAEEEAEEDEGVARLRHVSLGELGYGPAKIKTPQFATVEAASSASDDGLSAAITDCKDGFALGSVVVKEIPKNEPVVLPVPLPDPCPCDDQLCLPPPPVVPPCGCFNTPYTYLSSSSGSAHSNAYSNSVFLQKVGCH